MKLKHQGLILIGSSLALEIIFMLVVLYSLAPIKDALRYRSSQVSIITTLQVIFNSILLLEEDLFSTSKSHAVKPPSHILETQDRQLRYRTGQATQIRQVHDQDSREINSLLQENPDVILNIGNPEVQNKVEVIGDELSELDKASNIRPDLHQFSQTVQTELNQSVNQLYSARQSKPTQKELKQNTSLPALITLRKLLRKTWQKATEEWDRQEIESIGAAGFNETVIIQSVAKLNWLIAAGALASVLTAIFLLTIFGIRSWRRISVLQTNMSNFTQRQPLLPVLHGNDEFAAIDKTFHQMAATLAEIQHRQRAIIENSTELLCLLDESGQILAVSPACKKVLGWQEHDLIGKLAQDTVTSKSRPDWQQAFNSVKSASAITVEAWVTRKDNTDICCQWSMRWNESDQTMVCVIRDVSARKEAERQKQEFIAMVSQDLQRPLVAIKQCLENLLANKYGEIPEMGVKLARQSFSSNDRLIVLVNDLLDIDRLSGQRMDLNYSRVSSTDLVNRSLEAVKSLAAKTSIQTQAAGEDVSLECDPYRIVQVLVNLLGNALKFSPSGSSVVCSAQQVEDSVIFKVVDQGRGIPASMLDSVFEKFEQVTKTDATQKGGAGLGLAICKTIIKSHEGEIGVESQEGKGSTFWFRLPLKKPAAVHDSNLNN